MAFRLLLSSSKSCFSI